MVNNFVVITGSSTESSLNQLADNEYEEDCPPLSVSMASLHFNVNGSLQQITEHRFSVICAYIEIKF